MSAPATILIVDDDPIVRGLMQDALENDGFRVIEATNGEEAFRRCLESVPSLLVADAVMPVMDGFTLCQKLRAERTTQHMPILMATGLEDHASITRAFEAGATDFVSKPLNWLILGYRIRYMLRNAGTVEDLRHSQARLRLSQDLQRQHAERFEAALGNMSQGLCMFGSDHRLIVTNHQFRDLYGLSHEDVTAGKSMTDVLQGSPLFASENPDDVSVSLVDYIEFTLRRESAVLTQELPDGRIITITHEPMAGGGFVDTFTDVTDQRRAAAQIAHLALHDPLTDLPNRALFRERLDNALHRVSRGDQCAIFCLDLDHFKNVNDTLGHPVGDELLKEVAKRLRRVVRLVDTVARVGGDEFAIVQSAADQPRAATFLASRILRALEFPFEVAGHQVVIGASIGISIAPSDGSDPDKLIKNADIALYEAKSNGRNCFRCFEHKMDAEVQARRALELDLRTALTNEEFQIHYQPLVSLREEGLIGFEALLRWRSGRRGMVRPAEFIPLAEELGLITQIGAWVLGEACRHAAAWPEPLKVAVNISTVQFNGRNLLQTVIAALEESGLKPERLELEITESVMVQDFDAALATLHDLRNLGVSISMDDFGTGYSSLSYLRSFPFDRIKIDQSFVRELGQESDSMPIIRAVLGMCESLGIPVTAEGVETQHQLRMLSEEGCNDVQGFLISEPRPVGEVAGMIRDFSNERPARLEFSRT